LPIDALVCKYCGSDDQTAWSPNTLYDGIDLPEENVQELSSFWKTQLGKDLKYLVLVALLMAFTAYIFKF